MKPRFETVKEDRTMTDLSRLQHPRFARMYEQISAESERRGTAEHRDRVLAEAAADRASVRVRVVVGHATALPAGDASFDAAVASLVLCSVSNVDSALAEIRRVLKPSGELRFFEHVRSDHLALGLLQDAITPLWSRVGGGCHPNRSTAAAIEAAGFGIEQIDRFSYAPLRFFPKHSHILGRARAAG